MKSRTREWRDMATALASVLALAVAGCGGGGGGGDATPKVLSGAVNLDATAELLVPSSISATLPPGTSGQPTCTLVSGSVPPGMSLGAGCSLAGTPNQVGSFASRLDLTLPGYSGSVAVNVFFVTAGPILGPSAVPSSQLSVGSPVSGVAVVGLSLMPPFALRSTDVLTYRLVGGSLPPGISLNPSDGTLFGTPTLAGGYVMQIGASLTRNGQSYELNPFSTSIGVI